MNPPLINAKNKRGAVKFYGRRDAAPVTVRGSRNDGAEAERA